MGNQEQIRPTEETATGRRVFDQLASLVDRFVSSTTWFILSVAGVLVWLIWGPFSDYSERWQLVINTSTTILTFLLVGLAANAGARNTKAVQLKLNAIASALEDLMEDKGPEERREDAKELRAAIGLEHEASS